MENSPNPEEFHVEITAEPDLSPVELPPLISAPSAAPFFGAFRDALTAWLVRTPSHDTRSNYARDLRQFCDFALISPEHLEALTHVVPWQVAAWRDHLHQQGMSASTIRRKLTVLRSLFSYLRTYGYLGANPAHSDFVTAPAVPRDGKTVGLTPEECRRLLDAPDAQAPVGIRDRAILGVLAFSACRVGELVKVCVGDYKSSGGHRILEIHGKGGKERRAPLHPEAFERLESWVNIAAIRDDHDGPIFRPPNTSRGSGYDGFARRPLSRRAVQFLVEKLVRRLCLDPAVSVHSLRVTALTTARERGCDIIDLQIFAGHADPRTTLTYIRNRDRLSRSPTYVLKY